jgi:PAS domain S-box-containing protein
MIKDARQLSIKFDQATVGYAYIDSKTGRFIKANKRFCDIMGYEEDAVTEITIMDIAHPSDLNEKMHNIQSLLEGEKREVTVEKCFTREDGSIMWINLSLSVLWDENETTGSNFSSTGEGTSGREVQAGNSHSVAKQAIRPSFSKLSRTR